MTKDESAAVPLKPFIDACRWEPGEVMGGRYVIDRDKLAAQGLHVVSDADMAVLEAIAKADIRVNDTGYDGPVMPLEDEYAVCRTELARREGKP